MKTIKLIFLLLSLVAGLTPKRHVVGNLQRGGERSRGLRRLLRLG